MLAFGSAPSSSLHPSVSLLFRIHCVQARRVLGQGLSGEESACQAGDSGSVPGSGRYPGAGNGNSLQYSCLKNPMDRGAWRATVHRIAKSRTQLRWVSISTVVVGLFCPWIKLYYFGVYIGEHNFLKHGKIPKKCCLLLQFCSTVFLIRKQ